MIIDFHAHVGLGTPGSTAPEQTNLPPEATVQGAREAGIDQTVVFPVQYLTHEYPGANEEVAAAVAAYPGELIGFARVNPGNLHAQDQVRDAVQRLETSQTRDMGVLNEAARQCPDQVLFGTDAVIGPEKRREMDKVRGLDCPEAIKAKILGGNAARLLR